MELHASADIRLVAPFTMIVAGPTGSGKTVKIMELIDNAASLCVPPPVEIVYCYGEWQSAFEKRSDRVTFHEGVLDVDSLPDDKRHRWLVVDDLMDELLSRDDAAALFTKRSHHRNLSVIFVVQNLFHKKIRTLSINAHYILLAKSPRDSSSVLNLAKQVYPGETRFAMEAYRDATKAPHSFLTLVMTQTASDSARVLANFPPSKDRPCVAYVPRTL
jgi:hypothetical protein